MDHLVLLQESDDVGFAAGFDEVLKVTGRWVVDFELGLYLSNSVDTVHFTDSDLKFAILLLDQAAKEVSAQRCVEEEGSIVHLVFEDSKTFEVVQIYLAKQFELVNWALQDEFTIGADVPGTFVFVFLSKHFFAWHLVAVIVPSEAGGHSEVVQEERVLVNVLEEAELSLVKGQLESVLKVIFRVQLVYDVIILFDDWNTLDGWVPLLLLKVQERPEDGWSVERLEVIVRPVKLVEGEIFDTLGVV